MINMPNGIKIRELVGERTCKKRGCVEIKRDGKTIIEIHSLGSRYGWSWQGIYLPTVLQGLFNTRKQALRTIIAALR